MKNKGWDKRIMKARCLWTTELSSPSIPTIPTILMHGQNIHNCRVYRGKRTHHAATLDTFLPDN